MLTMEEVMQRKEPKDGMKTGKKGKIERRQ